MVKRRIEKKKISLGRIVSWQDLQREIQLMQTLLYKLYALDPFTKKYRYLNYLLNNEALYEKLKELDKALVAYDKEFVVDTYFGLVQLSDASKEALEQLLTRLGTAISQNQLILSLANIIKQFDPEAKKIAEQEKKAIQQAIAKKHRPTFVPLESVGGEPTGSLFGGGSLDMFGFGGFGPSFGSSPYSTSNKQPEASGTSSSGSGNKSGSGSSTGGASKDTDKNKDKDKDKEKDKGKEKEKKEEQEKKKEERARTQEALKKSEDKGPSTETKKTTSKDSKSKISPVDNSPNGLIQQIDDLLHEARNLMFPSDKISEKTQVLSPLITINSFAADKPISFELITVNIPKFYQACKKINDLVKQLTTQLAKNPNLRANAEQKLKAEWEFRTKDQETGDSAGFTQWLEHFAIIVKELSANPNSIGKEQAVAFFWNREADNTVQPPVTTTPPQLPDAKELKAIFDDKLAKLEKTVKTTSKEQAQAYNAVKQQIDPNNIRSWLEFRTILINGIPSKEFELLKKDAKNPFAAIVSQAREQASIEIIKKIRYASLYNIAIGLLETKAAIETFIFGKPKPLSIPRAAPQAETELAEKTETASKEGSKE